MQSLFILVFGFVVIRFLVTLTNVLLNPKLPTKTTTHSAFLSILIPARNEAANIGNTIQHILKQDFQHFELIVLDDHSTDATAQIVQEWANAHPQIKLIAGAPLPKGWLGKNWACHQLAQSAKGDYLLFVDADVCVYNQLIPAALTEMKAKELTLLSIFPDQHFGTWGERIVVPIMHYLLLTMLPLRFVRLFPQSSLAAANGQFMLFQAADYHKHQFHQQVKQKVTEDIEIVKLIKRNGLFAGTYLGNNLVACRMYSSWNESVQGFSKNLLAGFGSILGLLVFMGLVFFAYFPIFWLEPQWMVYILPFILITNGLLAWLSNQSSWQTICLHPLKMLSLCLIACLSIYRNLTRTNQWKGRNISIK
ncbi:MAG: glycosyltransferase [Flammeovirgaceae bacterium]